MQTIKVATSKGLIEIRAHDTQTPGLVAHGKVCGFTADGEPGERKDLGWVISHIQSGWAVACDLERLKDAKQFAVALGTLNWTVSANECSSYHDAVREACEAHLVKGERFGLRRFSPNAVA